MTFYRDQCAESECGWPLPLLGSERSIVGRGLASVGRTYGRTGGACPHRRGPRHVATVQNVRHATAVDRALGASSEQAMLAVVVAQLFSAVPGAIVGVPIGIGLYIVVGRHGSGVPSALGIVVVILLTLAAVAVLTAIPARIGARRSVAEVLQAEAA
jgi:hypothetical protein